MAYKITGNLNPQAKNYSVKCVSRRERNSRRFAVLILLSRVKLEQYCILKKQLCYWPAENDLCRGRGWTCRRNRRHRMVLLDFHQSAFFVNLTLDGANRVREKIFHVGEQKPTQLRKWVKMLFSQESNLGLQATELTTLATWITALSKQYANHWETIKLSLFGPWSLKNQARLSLLFALSVVIL